MTTDIIQSGTSGTSGANGSGGAGGAGQVEAGGYTSMDISAVAEGLDVVLTGGNGGIGGDGMGGAEGVLTGTSWSAGGNGSPGGNAGAAGTAEFDLTNDTIGTAGVPDPNEIDITASTIGGNGNLGGFGGAGGSTGIDEPSEGITGGQGGNGAASGDDSDGALSTNTITNLTANMSYGGMISINAIGGNGGTFDLNDNRAAGGNGAVGGIGGSAYSGGNGGNAITTLSASTLTAGEFLGIDLSAEGGQGGDAGVQAAGGSSDGVAQPAKDGTVGNGGNAGNATVTLTGNTITVGTATQNGIFTIDAAVRTYTASIGSVDPTLKFEAGAPGLTAPGKITITNNTVTLGAGSGLTSGALMTLDLQNLELQTQHEIVGTEPLVTETLNGGAGGNLDFSGNSFDGGGGGELTLDVGGGGVTADLLDNTISIGGSVDNALIGFNTVILDDGETFIAGRDSETVEIGEASDTVVFTAESGNLEISGDTSTLVTGGATIDFAGFGPGLDAAAIAADTSVVSGNTFIKVGSQTLEILGFTGNASSIEHFTSLPALTQIVVTVAQMEGFETSHTLPAAGSTYIVTDTAANIEAATATQIRGFAANGASAIVSTDATVAFTVAQTLQIEGELTVTVPAGDGVIVSDTAANIEALTTAQIAALPAAGFTRITATNASVALTVAQGEALAASGLPLTVPPGAALTVADTFVALEALTPAEILALKAAGITGLTSTVGSPVFTVAQALALADPLPVSAPGGTVTIGDTAANLETLTGGDITALAGIGFTGFTSKDASVVLTVAQAEAIGDAGIVLTVPTHDTITVADTAADIEAMSKAEILSLHAAGVTKITATDGSVVLSITQAQGLEFPLPVAVPMGDTLTIADTAANIESLTAGDIGQLAQIGFTKITATDAPVMLTLADAEAFTAGGISLTAPMGDTVTVADTAADIQALTGSQITELKAAGVTGITSTDISVALSLTQAEDLAGVGIKVTVPMGDTAEYSDTVLNLQNLTTGQIADLVAAGVTVISPTNSGSPGFSVAQTLALEAGGVRVVVPPPADSAHIVDDATAIETLTPDQIKALPAAGFGALNAFGETLNLTLDQVHALETANIGVPFDTVILSETAAAVEALTPNDVTGFEQFGVGTIAADGSVVLTVAQALNLNGITVTVPMGDAVTIMDTAVDIAALSADDIGTLSRIGATAISVTDGSITLTLDQVQALESAAITLTAPMGDQVVLTDTAADIEALGQSDIAALGAIGVTKLQATDASIVLTAADIQAFQSANIALSAPMGDTVTVSDTAADIETLSQGDIGALSASGVTAITATDASVMLTVTQALALESAGIAISVPAHDGVIIVDTEAAIDALTPMQIAGLNAAGITGIDVPSLTGADPVTIPSGVSFTVDGAISANQTIDFSAPGGVLALGDPGDDAGTIAGFGPSDTIDLTSVAFDANGSVSLQAGNSLGVIENGVGYEIQLDPAQSFLGDRFVLSDDGKSGTDIKIEQAAITTFVTISAGQTVSGLIVGAGGEVDVLSGGMLTGGPVSSGGEEIVESGGVISGATVDDGGVLTVNAGGTTVGVVLNDPGQETVSAGGTASGTLIDGGELDVYGSATGTFVMSGTQIVESGGTSTDITVSNGGFFEILSGASANGVTVLSGGVIELIGGGTVSGLKVDSGGEESIYTTVASGQTVSGVVVSNDSEQAVQRGGKAVGTVVQGGGLQQVQGSATGTVLSGAGAHQYVYSGGVADGTIIRSGGYELVFASGHTSGIVVSSGGVLQIFSGIASGITVLSGGELVVSGATLTGVTLSKGAIEGGDVIGPGVVSSSITVGSGQSQTILSGGVAVDTVALDGGVQIVSGKATGTILSSGGIESVSSGGAASGTHVLKGGELIYAGGTVTGAVVGVGGLLAVATGAKASGMTVGTGVTLTVSSGGTASGAIVSSGGKALVISGGTTVGATVSSGGVETVSSGAHASGTTVLKGGEIVYDGGTVTGSTISSGGVLAVAAGAKASGMTVGTGVTLTVSSGGTASGAIVSSGGKALVISGGTTVGATVSSGGIETVSSGAHASGTHVLKGGEIVYDGGTVTTPVIASGGSEAVAAGVKVSGLTVGAGVTLIVSSGGTASATVLGGTEIVSAGGIVAGTTKFAAHGKLTVSATTGVALSISGFAATDTLDLAGFGFKAAKLTFVENNAKTSGVLTVTDGALHASVTLFGQYIAKGFQLASDGAAGTDITYVQPPASHLELIARSV